MNKRRAPGVRWVRPVLVTLLAVLMLVNVCVPGIYASAETVEKDYQYYYNAVTELETAAETDLTAEQASTYKAQADTLKTEIEAAAAATILDPTAAAALQTRLDAVITAMDKLSVSQVSVEEESADGETGTDGAADDGEEAGTDGAAAEQTHFEKLMVATTCREMLTLMMADTDATYALTQEELTALTQKTESMTDDADQEELLETLAVVAEDDGNEAGVLPTDRDDKPEDSNRPGAGGNYTLSQENYSGNTAVYYDVMVPDSSETNGYSGYNGTTSERVTSVTFGSSGAAVVWGESDQKSGWSGGSVLSTYYGLDLNSDSDPISIPLVITPAPGYYVTKVVVACCDGRNTPYGCGTWGAGNAYTQSFSIGQGGATTLQVPSNAFGHSSGASNYFILIEVAPIPTPLYVEYDFGEIRTHLGDAFENSQFATPANWTASASNNNLGTGSLDTNDTQYMYAYDENNGSAASWTHNANTVTDAAKGDAAEVGYYFTGWHAEYYTTVSVSDKKDGNGNEKTYIFSSEYGTANYSEGAAVALTTNVRLIAQWAPVKLNVQKKVAGLDSYQGTYTVQLKKDNANFGETHDFTVAGSSTSDAWTISPITPGTYTIVETSPEIGSAVIENGTNKYLISTTYSEAVNVTAADIVNGTYREGTLTVTNTYSDVTPALKLVKKWQDVNGDALTATATANMPTVTFTVTCGTHIVNQTVTLSYDAEDTTNYGWVKTLQATDLELPEGCTIGDLTVTETVPAGYILVDGSVATSSEEDVNEKIIYTVFTATNQLSTTKITLDKNVTGNLASYEDEFTFTVTVNDESTTYKLKHGTDPVVIEVPVGAKVEITETAVNGYTASATVDKQTAALSDGTTLTIESVAAEGHAVVFTNTKEAVIETGVDLNSFPFYVLISTAVVFAGILLVDKARYGKKF